MIVDTLCARYSARNVYLYDGNGKPLEDTAITWEKLYWKYGDYRVVHLQIMSKESVVLHVERVS